MASSQDHTSDSLAAQERTVLGQDPFYDHVFCFRGPPWGPGQIVHPFVQNPGSRRVLSS